MSTKQQEIDALDALTKNRVRSAARSLREGLLSDAKGHLDEAIEFALSAKAKRMDLEASKAARLAKAKSDLDSAVREFTRIHRVRWCGSHSGQEIIKLQRSINAIEAE